MNEVLHSVRVSPVNWMDEERFETMMELFQKYPCGISQITLFVYPVYHTPTPLEKYEPYVEVMKNRMKKIREYGYSTGLNVLATIGHHEENLPNCYMGDTYPMTDIEGNICRGSHCMNDERYLKDYVVPLYQLMARTEPDYIWIDDDIRYWHHPLVTHGCFCDGCIELFNRTYGTAYTREELKKAFNSGEIELRKKWLKKQSDAVAKLLGVVGSAVRSVSKEIRLGFMSDCWFMERLDFAAYAAALSDNGQYEVMWRPGSGSYNDRDFYSFLGKSEQIGRLNAFLPSYVTSIQSEIEGCGKLIKTPVSVAAETLLYMTSGCTGAALNILPGALKEPMINIEGHLKVINTTIPFARLLAEKLRGLKNQGIHNGWCFDSYAGLKSDNWAGMPMDGYIFYAQEVYRLGVPQCFNGTQRQVTMLTGEMARALTDEEIFELLKGGLMLNAEALAYINFRGFGEYTGFEAGEDYPLDAMEMYVDDPFNEGFVGGTRNCAPVFGAAESSSLIPVGESVRVLSKLVGYNGNEIAPCASGIYENSLGGRICAVGYHPFSELTQYWKSIQLKRLFVYLSKNTLPSYTKDCFRMVHRAHQGEGRFCITLMNPTNQPLEDVKIAALTQKEEVTVYTQYQPETPYKAAAVQDGAYREITIKKLPPFEMVLIEL